MVFVFFLEGVPFLWLFSLVLILCFFFSYGSGLRKNWGTASFSPGWIVFLERDILVSRSVIVHRKWFHALWQGSNQAWD